MTYHPRHRARRTLRRRSVGPLSTAGVMAAIVGGTLAGVAGPSAPSEGQAARGAGAATSTVVAGSVPHPSSLLAEREKDVVSRAGRRAVAAREARAARLAEERRRAREAERALANAQEDPQSAARVLLAEFGFAASEFDCLDAIYRGESNWRWNADNPSSSAYGIPQALPGSKMALAGADWATNPVTQIRWGLGYIRDRYGSPCSAWGFKQGNGWY